MSFHAGFAKKTPLTRSSNSSTDSSLKRKSGDVQDAENRSPNIKTKMADAGSSKKTRITRSTSGPTQPASGLQQPKRSSKLPAPATRSSSKLPSKAAPESRRRAVDKSTSERAVRTPSKCLDRTSLLSPCNINSSSKPPEVPSSVMKFPKQCSAKIKGFFDRAPIKSEEEINQLINPKLKPKNKWVDFREKAKRQTEVIVDLKGVLKDTLLEYNKVQEDCVGAERTMEEQYQSIRNTLKMQIKSNAELKTNEAQLQSEFSKIFSDLTKQTAEVKELRNTKAELTEKNNEFTKMVSELADKLTLESDTRALLEASLEAARSDLSAALEDKSCMLKDMQESNDKVGPPIISSISMVVGPV